MLKDHYPAKSINTLEKYKHPRLIVPSEEHVLQCCLTVIHLAEQALAGQSHSAAILSRYHYLPIKSPKRIFICTGCSDCTTIKHEEVDVKVIMDSSHWMDPVYKTSSDLFVNMADTSVELYSLIVSGGLYAELDTRHDENGFGKYDCTVKISITEYTSGKERYITNFEVDKKKLPFEEEYEIILNNGGKKTKLMSQRRYKIKLKFSIPHPLWFSDQYDKYPPKDNELCCGCGYIGRSKSLRGTHIKYLMYKIINN